MSKDMPIALVSKNYCTSGAMQSVVNSAKPKGRDNIWEEYYPLLAPQNIFRSTLPICNLVAPEVVCAYQDGVHAFIVILFSLSTLSLIGLLACKSFFLPYLCVLICRLLWLCSPAVAGAALRKITTTQLAAQSSNNILPPMWELPPYIDLFRCNPKSSMARLLLLSYCIPLFCQVAAYTLTAATRMVNPVIHFFLVHCHIYMPMFRSSIECLWKRQNPFLALTTKTRKTVDWCSMFSMSYLLG
jgi:hypothetical protein